MEQEFFRQFCNTQRQVGVQKLIETKQRKGKKVTDFIARWRGLTFEFLQRFTKHELVQMCLNNLDTIYPPHSCHKPLRDSMTCASRLRTSKPTSTSGRKAKARRSLTGCFSGDNATGKWLLQRGLIIGQKALRDEARGSKETPNGSSTNCRTNLVPKRTGAKVSTSVPRFRNERPEIILLIRKRPGNYSRSS